MAVSKAYLCTKMCEIAGHVRKKPELNGLTKKELLILFSYMTLSRDKEAPRYKSSRKLTNR